VSNFGTVNVLNLTDNGSMAPMVNQVGAHVGGTPFDLIEDMGPKGNLVEAYSPVAHGALLHDGRLWTLADTYGVRIAQLCLRYCLQLGLHPLPKTAANPAHLRRNATLDSRSPTPTCRP
jgi:diketogulonate reductase-like aldo/keto reductase